jgi:hypothetical protein
MNITRDYAETICLMGKRALCCRFLVGQRSGFGCAKLDLTLSMAINERYAAGTMTARGDNCPGFPMDAP